MVWPLYLVCESDVYWNMHIDGCTLHVHTRDSILCSKTHAMSFTGTTAVLDARGVRDPFVRYINIVLVHATNARTQLRMASLRATGLQAYDFFASNSWPTQARPQGTSQALMLSCPAGTQQAVGSKIANIKSIPV